MPAPVVLITSATPRHVIHGTTAAFRPASTGVPLAFKFSYGTWACADVAGDYSNASARGFGVINSYSVKHIGEKSNLRDGSGNTMAIPIMDPGWMITGTIMVQIAANNIVSTPIIGGVMEFTEKTERNRGSQLIAVVTSVGLKWEKEGWAMLDFEAEHREAMMTQPTVGAILTENGAVARQLHQTL